MSTLSASVHTRVRGLIVGIVVTGLLGGCAGVDRTSPSASIAPPREMPTGAWRGTLTSREMGDASGQMSVAVELTLDPDGTFVLEDTSGGRASGQARFLGDTLLLEGTFVSPASRAGERVSERLRRGRAEALYGTIETTFRGLKVSGAAALHKVL